MIVLLVEDDLAQLQPLRLALAQTGHLVDGVDSATSAQWLMAHKDYDLLILDWMLPDVSGITLCQQYRAMGKSAPILILTAKDTTEDKVAGLDAGADDYLVKPVDVIELLARVRALGRRSPRWNGEIVQVGDLLLSSTDLTLSRGDRTVLLSNREFHLMEYFMRRPNQILSRERIELALWEWDKEPESNAVTTLVRRLRQRLQVVEAKDWLETVYGVGYRLKAMEIP